MNWQDRENPQAGGAEVHLHEVFGRIAAAGHEVVLLCSGFAGGSPRTRIDGIDVHRVGGRYSFALHARRYHARHLARAGFDVIVEDLNKIPLHTPRWGRTPVVLLVHHLFGATAFREASPPVAALTWLSERGLARAYHTCPVIAVSPSTRDDLVDRGFDHGRIEVIPNGVDLTALAPADARFATPTITYVGRLKRYKGVGLVLDALAVLRARGHEVRFIVAGKGDERPRLEARARQLGLADLVEFRGFVDEASKRELLQRAWLHVLPSAKEGWGLTVLEAAACGTPTVASDVPGLRDSVRDGQTGLLVPHGEAGALAEALGRLLADPVERARMGRACTTLASGYSWDAAAARVTAVLAAATRVDSGRPRP